MLVHVYREHTLRLLGMQSLCRASVSDLPHGVRQDRLGVDRQTGTAKLYGASSHERYKVVHGQKTHALILIVSLSL